MINSSQLQTNSTIILIPNHLTLTIINPGYGSNPQPGQFIRYRQVSYLEKVMQFLKEEIIEVPFQRDKLIPALEKSLSFFKQNSRIKIWTSSALAYGNSLHDNIPAGSNLIFDVQVFNISNIPSNISTNQGIFMLFEEILSLSKDGDECMKKGNFQQALNSYEKAVNQIIVCDLKDKIAQLTSSSMNEKHEMQVQSSSIKQNFNTDRTKILIKFQYTCFKYLELCYSVGEYLKVVTITPKLTKSLNIDIHQRIQKVLVLTYLQLDQIELAERHYRRLKTLETVRQQIVQNLEKQISTYKSKNELTSKQGQKIE